jgi:hypothetical protein
LLAEAATSQGVHAEGADKVLRVPLLVQSTDTSTRDGFAASSTERSSLQVVVSFTVGLALVFEENSIHKGFLAVMANKVFRVPL